MEDNSPWEYSKNNIKPGLQVTIHEAKGSKEEQARIEKIAMLGRLYDAANDPRLAPNTRLKKLYAVRRGYVDAGFDYLESMTTRLINIIRNNAG
jgi:hypothetical protein